MSLGINYFKRLKRVECTGGRYCDKVGHVWLFTPEFLPDRLSPLHTGCHQSRSRRGGGFHAGSYSGYSRWRTELAALVDLSPEQVWRSPNRYAHRPFVELINFSDCEGAIGPAASAELARDFAEHAEKARVAMNPYSFESYQNWWRAFEIASDGGAVVFS